MNPRDLLPTQGTDVLVRRVLRRLPPSDCSERLAPWWGSRFRAGPAEVRLRNGVRMLVEPRDYLLNWLYYLGTFEPHRLRLLPQLLPEGGVMVDVGANIGVYTLSAARIVGPSGRVVAIEPMPTNAAALGDNISRNAFDWVEVVDSAVGDEEGSGTLRLPPNSNPGCFTVGKLDSPGSEHVVRLARLDDLLEGCRLGRVDMIKLDIAGSELGALRGAAGVIAEHRPAILIELNEAAVRSCGASSGEVRGFFSRANYRGWIVNRDGPSPLRDSDFGPATCIECLFCHRDSAPPTTTVRRGRSPRVARS